MKRSINDLIKDIKECDFDVSDYIFSDSSGVKEEDIYNKSVEELKYTLNSVVYLYLLR